MRIGIFGILFLIYLTLKLAEVGVVKYWSWWCVTSPLWLPFVVGFGILIILSIFKE
jgi:hypothetical protein